MDAAGAAADVPLAALDPVLAVEPKSDVLAAPPLAAPDEPKLNTGAVEVAAEVEEVVGGAEVKLPNEKPLLVAGAEDDDELLTVEVAAVAAEGREKEKDGAVDEGAAEVDRDDEEDDELRLEPKDRPPEPNSPPLDDAPPAAAVEGAAVEVVEPTVPNEKLGADDEAAGVPKENAGAEEDEAAEEDRVDVEPNSGNDRCTTVHAANNYNHREQACVGNGSRWCLCVIYAVHSG